MFISRLVKGPDIRIFGRAVALKHQEGRDDATQADIQLRPWKFRWPRYIRIHNAEFVAGTMANGVSLAELMDTLGSASFATTQRNAARREGNTNPRRSFMEQPAVRLSSRWRGPRIALLAPLDECSAIMIAPCSPSYGERPRAGNLPSPLSSSIYKLPFNNRSPRRFEVGDTGLLGSLVDSPYKMGINRAGFVNAPLARLDAKHPRRREWMESSTRAIGCHSRRATRRRHPWASRWMSQREIRRRRVRSRLPPPPFLFGQRRHHSMVASNWLNSGVFWGYTREFPGTETRLSAL